MKNFILQQISPAAHYLLPESDSVERNFGYSHVIYNVFMRQTRACRNKALFHSIAYTTPGYLAQIMLVNQDNKAG